MDSHETLFSTLNSWALAVFTALFGLVIGVIRWAYVRDTAKTDDALGGMKADHGRLIEMVNEINATRPRRTELTEAIEGIREEVASEFASLRGEIRSDINGLRTDMTTRLDTLIRLQGGK